jgi:hypothetical protein
VTPLSNRLILFMTRSRLAISVILVLNEFGVFFLQCSLGATRRLLLEGE